ncbi:MAG: twin-arginine translocation signal domain-containing protein, partial [Blastocatellia bacterium]
MNLPTSRRHFLKTTATSGALLGLGDLSFLAQLPGVSRADAQLNPKAVRLQPEIEPIVRLLEETPRAALLEEVARRIKQGLQYRELLAALLLAGVRNIQPRPVGFKFHAVLVVNSAHLASLASPDSDRWLPIFWSLDHFKDSQARDVREGDWTMAQVNE